MRLLPQKIALFVFLLIFTNHSFSQLSGNYKIGPTGIVFQTLTEAIDSLNLAGVDGLVEFEIEGGPISGSYVINPLVSYEAGDSLAIKPYQDEVPEFNHLSSPAYNYVFKLNGASHISINGLKFIGTDVTYCRMIKVTNGASFNTIDGNDFNVPDGGVLDESVVIFDDESGMNEEHNTYSNNTIVGGSIGIKLKGNSISHQGPSYVYGNTITGSTYVYGLKMEYINGGEVKKNHVEGEVYLLIDSSFTIEDNYFECFTTSYAALRIIDHDNSVHLGNLTIANNVLVGLNNSWACHISGSKYFDFYHNTLYTNANDGPQTIYVGFVSDMDIRNNIIVNQGTYEVVHFTDFGANITVDYNTYYSGGGGVGLYGGFNYTSFFEWQSATPLDDNSTYVLPQFVAPNNYKIKCTSGSDLLSTVLLPGVTNDHDGSPRVTVPVWKGAYNAVSSDTIMIDGFVADGLDTLKAGKVKIYGDKTSKVMLDSLGVSELDENGYFKFEKVPYLREYWVKIIPDRSLAPEYVVCYQDTSLRWDNTSPIVVTDSCVGEQISLVPRKMVSIEDGTNLISGYVTDISGAGKVLGTDPIPGLDVVLDRIPPSKTVAFTQTDENGYYGFGNLPDGNYVVSIDYEGLHSDTIYDIVIDGGSERNHLDYCVDRNDRIQGCASGVGTDEQLNIATNVFPNPFGNELNIQTELENYDLTIFNMEGKVVLNDFNLSGQGQINTSNLSPGVYLLEINSKGFSKKSAVVKY